MKNDDIQINTTSIATTPIQNQSSWHGELIYIYGIWFTLLRNDISLPQDPIFSDVPKLDHRPLV